MRLRGPSFEPGERPNTCCGRAVGRDVCHPLCGRQRRRDSAFPAHLVHHVWRAMATSPDLPGTVQRRVLRYFTPKGLLDEDITRDMLGWQGVLAPNARLRARATAIGRRPGARRHHRARRRLRSHPSAWSRSDPDHPGDSGAHPPPPIHPSHRRVPASVPDSLVSTSPRTPNRHARPPTLGGSPLQSSRRTCTSGPGPLL